MQSSVSIPKKYIMKKGTDLYFLYNIAKFSNRTQEIHINHKADVQAFVFSSVVSIY